MTNTASLLPSLFQLHISIARNGAPLCSLFSNEL